MHLFPNLSALLLILGCTATFGYILLSEYHPDHPGKCYVQPQLMSPPLPTLDIMAMNPGDVLGTKNDPKKDYCRKLICSVFTNSHGEGYQLENYGCAVISKRPNNCTKYRREDLTLGYPQCCYHNICPRFHDEL